MNFKNPKKTIFKEDLHIAHGGHSGDIIYLLPFAKYLSSHYKVNLIYHVISNRPTTFTSGINHPNGLKFNMNENSFNFIKPLLEYQSYIKDVRFTLLEDLPIDCFKIDYYRDVTGLKLDAGNMQSWARKFYGYPFNTEAPWLETPKVKKSNTIICNFSRRYRNKTINYNFLDYSNVGFIGLKDEYEHFRNKYKLLNLQKLECSDALEMAIMIKSAKFFLGNQSFAFAIAESIKINRALEVCEITPNVIPSGHGANEYMNGHALKRILHLNSIKFDETTNNDLLFSHTLYLDD